MSLTTRYVVATGWFLILAAWPARSNLDPSLSMEPQVVTEEGLYASSLTDLGFGMLGFQLFETNEGEKHWNIRSGFAELHRKDNYAFMREVDAEFFAASTGNVVRTNSEIGRSYFTRSLVELEGDVKIQSQKGFMFTMDRLNYDSERHEFTTDDEVQMVGPNVQDPKMKLKGTGLWANIDTEHFKLRKKVTGQRKLKTSEWLKVLSNRGEFFSAESRALFFGSVHTTMPKLEIDSDKFEIVIQEDSEHLEAQGHVRLKNKERDGEADRAIIEVGSDRIVLEGDAKLRTKNNRLEGRKIILYTDKDRVDVEGASGSLKK